MDRRKAIRQTSWLAGAAILTPAALSMLQSCQTQPRLDWQPTFLSKDEAQFISAMLDTILPRTETPGALDVKADMFIDKLWAQTTDEAAQAQVRLDIAAFDQDCVDNYGSVFAKCDKANRHKALEAAEAKAGTFNGAVWGTGVGTQEPVGFYRSLKSTAIWAYMSSEEIGKNVLGYDPIPGGYDGCIALDSVGNKWSL